MKKITAEELAKMLPDLDSESIIVDVREVDEYKEAHIHQSINLPLSSIGRGISELKKFKTIYLICESGGRSQYAYDVLKTAAIETINIMDGLTGVKKAGVVLVEITD